jgi:hypothetical protein
VTDSDIPVLDMLLEKKKEIVAKEMSSAEYFEMFAAESILRDERVDPNDLESGLMGTTDRQKNGTDGGIDGFYIFVNGKIIRDLVEVSDYASSLLKNIIVNVVILQASTEQGFNISRLTRLSDTIEDIFSLNRPLSSFSEQYNESLRDAIERFRLLHESLLLKNAEFRASYFYITKGDTAKINNDIRGTARDIEQKTPKLLATIKEAKFEFVGARQLIELVKAPTKLDFALRCSNSITLPSSSACVALVPLKEFLGLITNDKGELRASLFESNVRDYQGEIGVNEEIGKTLEKRDSGKDFWWLNNGITIVAQGVGGTSTQVTLNEPQIVNGLQTSQKIFDYFVSNPDAKSFEARNVLVRMIPATTADIHDSIIRATNRQTSIPAAHLWASMQIHSDIETVFSGSGMYYDRRKNSWRRENTPFVNVVGITELAQSVASILRQEPDHARARPARYFNPKNHGKIFSPTNIHAYVPCARIKKLAALFLKENEPETSHRNNLLFYLLTASVCVFLKTAKPTNKKVSGIDINRFDERIFTRALEIVRPIYERHGADDKAAKGTEIVLELKAELVKLYPHKKQTRKDSGS